MQTALVISMLSAIKTLCAIIVAYSVFIAGSVEKTNAIYNTYYT